MPRFDPSTIWVREPLLGLFGVNRDIFMRTACLIGVTALFARLGAGLGDTVLTGNAVLLNFQTFTAFSLDGFAYAAEALVGLAVGARDRTSLRAASRVSMLWAGVGALGFSLAYLAAGPTLFDGLTNQEPVRAVAKTYLLWAIALPIASVWGFQFDSIFIGATRASDLRNSMALSLTAFSSRLGSSFLSRTTMACGALSRCLCWFAAPRWRGFIATSAPTGANRPAQA